MVQDVLYKDLIQENELDKEIENVINLNID